MPELNWADYVILGIIVLSTFISLIRGFIKEAISLATWVMAVWVVLKFTPFVSSYLTQLVEVPSLRLGIAALILFISTLIIGALINYIIGQLVEKTGFSGTDRTLGAVFGILRGVLVVGLMVILAGLTPIPQDPWWKQSYFLPLFQEKVDAYKVYLPPQIAEHFDFSRGSETVDADEEPDADTPDATSQPQSMQKNLIPQALTGSIIAS
jgi:membrane protein required for colicin V production